MGTPLAWIRNRCSTLFYRFGIHCATHQIRLILISGLVITSLFYPALGIYASSNSKFFPTSTHILAHIDLLSLSFFHDDLESVWSGHDALRTVQDTVSRARCGMGEATLRVERVLLTTNGFDSEHGAITHELLSSALKLETRLDAYARTHILNCLNSPSGGCLVLNPLEYWSHNEQILRADPDLLRTVNTAANISASGFPLRKTMVFAGRELAEVHDGSIDFAAYLALTYFFHEDDCNGSSGHNMWLRALDEITSSHGVVSVKAEDPVFLTLTFDPDMKSDKHISLITLTLYLSYIIFFIYFSGSMRRMDTVHSRVGLCVTGLVEILVSTVTSLSVCALYGLRLTLIPWGIFPIVIVFVGAENMFRLIDDVVKTPISLPVKERIGLGLGRAGTSNTLKVVSYNSILGVIAFFAQGAIRQFCAFAIVVLVAHWFLIHTFFVAVLSIDIQRLELDDLLRQNPSLAPEKRVEAKSVLDSRPKATIALRIKDFFKSIMKGRLTKNVSLLLMLMIAATLYYSTLPSSTTHHRDLSHASSSRSSKFPSASDQSKLAYHANARKVWRILNPDGDPRIHMRIEAPAIITLDRHLGGMKRAGPFQSRFPTRTLRPIWWIFKVMVIPIGATLSCLYLLLLYLLQGTDQLETTKEKRGLGDEAESEPIAGRPKLMTYPRAFASDAALLASSSAGEVLVSISIDGDVLVWLESLQDFIEIDPTVLSPTNASDSFTHPCISAIVVEDYGRCFAVGTGDGLVFLWSVNDNQIALLGRFAPTPYRGAVVELDVAFDSHHFSPNKNDPGAAFEPAITANYDGGYILQWRSGSALPMNASNPKEVLKAKLLRVEGTSDLCVCFFLKSGDVEVVDVSKTLIASGSVQIASGSPSEDVTDVDLACVTLNGKSHSLLAAARSSGTITIWSITEGFCIATIDDDYGFVDKLSIFPISSKACSQCGEVPLCSFCLVHSVGHLVFVDRGTLSHRCSCPANQSIVFKAGSAKENLLGRHSRSSSFVGSGVENGSWPRSRKSSITNDSTPITSLFPVSGHGVHSRRTSEKDIKRTNGMVDHNGVLSSQEELASTERRDPLRLSVPDGLSFPSQASDNLAKSEWRCVRMLRIWEASCERGGWDVVMRRIVGLCRKPRKHQRKAERSAVKQVSSTQADIALTSSVLDRWELWMIDPAKTGDLIQSSALSEIEQVVVERAQGRFQFPKLSLTRLHPVVIKKTSGLLGFGNTIGLVDLRSSLGS